MFARNYIQFTRRALAWRCLALLVLTTSLARTQELAPPAPIVAAVDVITTNRGTKLAPTVRPAVPPPTAAKRKAGFLAGTGLVILSLLVLATGLALVRTFKR